MATTQPAYNSAENSVATAPSTDRFTDRLWAETKVLRESIDSLEFLERLGDGTLPLDAFRTYIEQDKLYQLSLNYPQQVEPSVLENLGLTGK